MQIAPISRHRIGFSVFNLFYRPAVILLCLAITCSEIQAASKIEGLNFGGRNTFAEAVESN